MTNNGLTLPVKFEGELNKGKGGEAVNTLKPSRNLYEASLKWRTQNVHMLEGS